MCCRTVFSANNKLYQQIDGVSMGSSLGPVLANIIMTEMEKTIISCNKTGKLKTCSRSFKQL